MIETEELFLKASKAYEKGNFPYAFILYEKNAQNGHTDSMSNLAMMYCLGEGVDRDYEKSIEWDMRAVEQGSLVSLGNLGTTYKEVGNFEESEKWFKRAVNSGDIDSALELAILYKNTNKNNLVMELLELVLASDQVCDSSKEEAMLLFDEYKS